MFGKHLKGGDIMAKPKKETLEQHQRRRERENDDVVGIRRRKK
jgi:hypothetical protein